MLLANPFPLLMNLVQLKIGEATTSTEIPGVLVGAKATMFEKGKACLSFQTKQNLEGILP